MSRFTRRDIFKLGAGGLVAGAAGGVLGTRPAQAAALGIEPEKGAKLKILRWVKFVGGDQIVFEANTKKFTELTGVPVEIQYNSWEDIRPKAAVAANVGAGADIIVGWFDDPHLYPDKLVDVSDVADYLGAKYRGWAPVAKKYAMRDGRWIALPFACTGSCIVYRRSMMEAAGFSEFPTDMDGFLKLCQGLKKQGETASPGFACGHAVGDANNWTHWLVWSFGGRMVDENNNVVINSPETVQALEYARELYQTFTPGTLSWLDSNNNKAFVSGKIGLTSNGISIYYVCQDDKVPFVDDVYHANYPVGPVGRPSELHLFNQAMIFKYSEYPNAAKAYLAFMMEEPQMGEWLIKCRGLHAPCLNAYDDNPIWTVDPKHTPYRDCVDRMNTNGYAGSLSYASAAVMADYIMVDMVVSAATGDASIKDAIAQAERRARRYYD